MGAFLREKRVGGGRREEGCQGLPVEREVGVVHDKTAQILHTKKFCTLF